MLHQAQRERRHRRNISVGQPLSVSSVSVSEPSRSDQAKLCCELDAVTLDVMTASHHGSRRRPARTRGSMVAFDPRTLMERAIEVMQKSVAEPRADGRTSPLVGVVFGSRTEAWRLPAEANCGTATTPNTRFWSARIVTRGSMLSRNPVLHYVFARMELAEERGPGPEVHAERRAASSPATAKVHMGRPVFGVDNLPKRVGGGWFVGRSDARFAEQERARRLGVVGHQRHRHVRRVRRCAKSPQPDCAEPSEALHGSRVGAEAGFGACDTVRGRPSVSRNETANPPFWRLNGGIRGLAFRTSRNPAKIPPEWRDRS